MLTALTLMVAVQGSEPAPINVRDLCQFVAEKVHDPATAPGPTRIVGARNWFYIFETRLFAAAGVEITRDDAATVRRKIQSFWSRYQDQLYCNVLNSDVRNGHILRLAVNRSSDEFLNDVARRWRVDLNHVDATDGGTVLDYIDRELDKSRGTSRAPTLQVYRQLLESAGAKRARDLR